MGGRRAHKSNKASDRGKHSRVTDSAGRTFNHIKPLQLALWKLDWHLWDLLPSYLTRAAINQRVQESTHGSWRKKYGDHAGSILKALLEKLKEHKIACVETSNNTAEHRHRKKHWIEAVGKAQSKLPYAIIHEYCASRPFHPCPTFEESLLERCITLDQG